MPRATATHVRSTAAVVLFLSALRSSPVDGHGTLTIPMSRALRQNNNSAGSDAVSRSGGCTAGTCAPRRPQLGAPDLTPPLWSTVTHPRPLAHRRVVHAGHGGAGQDHEL